MKGCVTKYKGVDILLDVSGMVSSSLDLNEVEDTVLRESTKALFADHAALFLRDESVGRLMLVKARGFSKDEIGNIGLLGSWEAINAMISKEKKALLVNDVDKDPTFGKKLLPFSKERLPVKSFLAVPLKKKAKVTGTLIVSNKKRPGCLFSEEDEKFLSALSNHISIAIANAKLFEELGRAQAEAAQKEKMAIIGTLSAGINHEISNPLNIARGRCQAYIMNIDEGLYKERRLEDILAEAKEIMACVLSQTDRACAITRRLSDFSKPAKGLAEQVLVGKEVDQVLGLVSYELKFDSIEVEKRIADDLPPILVDRKQFQEVLFNLIRNAGQAIVKNGKIVIAASVSGGKVIIDIQDTGSGIPKEKIKELFNPFFTTKGPGKGTGLGLFIVGKIVEKNGGRIYLKKTKVGQGTTFTVEFPSHAPLAGAKK